MKRWIAGLLALALALLIGAPAGAGRGMKRLGEDPALDAPPALDLTYLDVGMGALHTEDGHMKGLEIRIGVFGMFPAIGGYPELPGIEWVFKVGKRVFVAEGVAGRVPRFFLFEHKDGSFVQLDSPAGTYDAADGFIRIVVPLKSIGAKRGTKIVGTDITGAGGDVDAHIHHAGTTYADVMETTKPFVIP